METQSINQTPAQLPPAQRPLSDRGLLRTFVESRAFSITVMTVILINAVTLGLETSPSVTAIAGGVLTFIDRAALWVFTIEMLLKLWVYRQRFFTRGWNLFDLSIVAISWIPATGALSVLRALRILRVLRLVSIVPQMRTVVGALMNALPGMGSIIAVLMLVFYVAAVMATKLFGADFPEWFGSIGASMYSLFQIMTLESWSMGIVRPIMDVYPLAWLFFVPFVIVTSFAVLNLFIALIVNSMQSAHVQDMSTALEMESIAHNEREQLLQEIGRLREDIDLLIRNSQKGHNPD